jgi:hypothetical protein
MEKVPDPTDPTKRHHAMDMTEHWDRLLSAGINILRTDEALQTVSYYRVPQRSHDRL